MYDKGMAPQFKEKFYFLNIDVIKNMKIILTAKSKVKKEKNEGEILSKTHTPADSPVNLDEPLVLDNVAEAKKIV